ncbi:MAG: HD domain-containing phosphohydrolase [Gemmatimonadota bacterium]
MAKSIRLYLYIALVGVSAVLTAVSAAHTQLFVIGPWQILAFVFIAFVLDLTGNPLRGNASGSVSFIVHMAACLLYGGFWGGAIAGTSTLASQLVQHRPPMKLFFNVFQRVLCIAAASIVYRFLGGQLPPAYLAPAAGAAAIQRDLGLFFVFSMIYFAINAIAVYGAIALSTGQSFRDLWNLNARGVLGYDLGASALSMLVAWLFRRSEEGSVFGPFGLVGVFVLILTVRHIYSMYRRLQTSGRELLDLMVKAIEARDPYTSGHSVRVATLAKAIAQEAGFSSAEVEQVYTAAILHDVGKIHEEFAPLLRKDSKLTREEMALLQTHSIKSAELVAIISSFRGVILDAVRSHHERWDGAGYPDGLAGEAIPHGARMIMISDTIDAMSTDRPYRKKLPLDIVLAELQKHSGTQFDPRLVELSVNSVYIRRVISTLQTSSDDKRADLAAPDTGGSKRMLRRDASFWRGRKAL